MTDAQITLIQVWFLLLAHLLGLVNVETSGPRVTYGS